MALGQHKSRASILWPGTDEVRFLGRFYLCGGVGYALALILPFQFAFFYLVMERPEWAVIPLLVSSAVALLLQVPAGLWADRWSRKKVALIGYALSGLSWAFVPMAVSMSGTNQLIAVCACFFLDGIGTALSSGSEDAWVVDNLKNVGRNDLVDQFFARSLSFESMGSIIAGAIALMILISTTVDSFLLNLLWYITAAGQIVVIAIAATIPEHRVSSDTDGNAHRSPLNFSSMLQTFWVIIRVRPLFFFVLVYVVVSFADSVTEDAFVMSMVTKGLDARALAPLGILEDAIGMIVPLFAVVLANRLGVSRYLAIFLIIPALAISALFLHPVLWVVVVLSLLLDTSAVLWDPVADAHLQALIPSHRRATITSLVKQFNGFAELAGLGVFALILGKHSERLMEATPDLIDSFSGQIATVTSIPTGTFGLSIPDIAITFFVLIGIFAVPFIFLSSRSSKN